MNKKLITAGVIGISALATGAFAGVPDAPQEWEKCAGIAKEGKNTNIRKRNCIPADVSSNQGLLKDLHPTGQPL